MRPPSAPPHNLRQSQAFSEKKKKIRLHRFRLGVGKIKTGSQKFKREPKPVSRRLADRFALGSHSLGSL